MKLEERLHAALTATTEQVHESPDLFARVVSSIEEDEHRRRWRWRWGRRLGAGVVALGAAATAASYRQGRFEMDWWILEIVTTIVLVALVLLLGPFIKRFGRGYAADVFRSNPGTGKSFIVLTDFAYYLVFTAYVLFTVQVSRPRTWSATVGAQQIRDELVKVGGMLLLMGLLHGVNLLILPVIGRLLTLNKRLDQQMRDLEAADVGDRDLVQPDGGPRGERTDR